MFELYYLDHFRTDEDEVIVRERITELGGSDFYDKQAEAKARVDRIIEATKHLSDSEADNLFDFDAEDGMSDKTVDIISMAKDAAAQTEEIAAKLTLDLAFMKIRCAKDSDAQMRLLAYANQLCLVTEDKLDH